MKRIISLLLLLLGAQEMYAQEFVMMRGQVRDSSLTVIPFANVLAKDTTTNEMEAFAVTDVKGGFQIRLRKDTAYELQVTYVGYIPYRDIIQLNETNEEPFIIVLKESINALDEVTVVAEMPVLVMGDTISYKADAFTDGDERKLEDVLEDLPGFEVNDNGEIEVQGQRVEKVLVDGKEFFEGDTKLATKNIPADVVDRIQVLQNYNDIAPLQGISNDDRLALNIELREDKKRIVFGDIEAGGGPDQRYFGHANAFYYAPNTNVNFIGDANNIGQLALTVNDYFRMSGGLASFASRNGTNFRLNAGDLGIPITDRNSARGLTNRLGALNFSKSLSEKLQISGFAIGFNNQDDLGSNSLRTYPQFDEITQERLITNSSVDNQSGLGRFSLEYRPNYNVQVDYNFFGKHGDILQSQLRSSELMNSSNQLTEAIDRLPKSQTHQLRMFSALNNKNIVSAELGYNEDKNETERHLLSSLPLFSGFLDTSVNELDQILSNTSKRFDADFNYYYLLNKTMHINGTFGVNRSNQLLNTTLLNGNSALESIDQQLNITNRYVGISFRKKWEKLTINPGINLNSYELSNDDGTFQKQQFLFPQFIADYDFGSSHTLRLNYRQSLEYNDVTGYVEGLILDSYNTLLSGLNGLKPAIYHTINMRYRNFNTYNFFNIHAGLNHQHIIDGFTQNQELSGIESILNSANSSQANQLTTFYTNLEKRFDHWRLSGEVNLSRSELNNQLENQLLKNVNFTQLYQLNFSAKLFKIWSLRVGYAVSVNEYSSGGLSNSFLNYQPNVSTVVSFKGLRLESTYTYNQYVNRAQNLDSFFDVWDASISYRKSKSPWEFKVQGLNLLDTREVRRDSFSNNLISTFSYFIQQRYGIVTIMYDI